MLRLINFGLHAIEIIFLLALMFGQRRLLRKGGKLMGQIDDLGAAVQAVASAEANEEARIDTLIAALQAPHDSPEVAAAIQQLEETRARLAAYRTDQPPLAPV